MQEAEGANAADCGIGGGTGRSGLSSWVARIAHTVGTARGDSETRGDGETNINGSTERGYPGLGKGAGKSAPQPRGTGQGNRGVARRVRFGFPAQRRAGDRRTGCRVLPIRL